MPPSGGGGGSWLRPWRWNLAAACVVLAQAGVDFTVTLRTAQQQQGTTGTWNIYYNDGYSWPEDWSAQFAKQDLSWYWGGAEFQYLHTAQFVVAAGDQPTILTVEDANTESGAKCAAALFEDRFLWFPLGAGGGLDLRQLRAPRDDAPLHLTIVPTAHANADCSPAGPVEALRAIAVWISVPPVGSHPPPANGNLCHFTVNGDILGNGCLNYPYWQYVSAQDGRPAFMVFKGTLVDIILKSQQTGTQLPRIVIDEGVDLDELPINAMLVRMAVESGSEQACANYDYNNCKVYSAESLTLDAQMPLSVQGYGRISGYQQLQNNRMKNPSLQTQWFNYAANPSSTTLAAIKEAAQYHAYSALLVLSSSSVGPSGYAIDVCCVTVGYGPTRNQGAVQMNSAYCPAVRTLSEPANNALNAKPVKMFDLKVVGNWIGASDGPEVMGPDTLQSYIYLHVNDDSIKVGAPRMKFDHMTVLQGNSGGVIDIGCYGLNRGVSGSRVAGVYVHRITHNTLKNGVPGYDGFNGIVTTRACPRLPFPGGDQQAGLVDVIVSDLSVPGLGWIGTWEDGTHFGPNSVTAPFSVSVNQAGSCGWGGSGFATNFLVSGLRFENWRIFVNPSWPSIAASYQLQGVSIVWGSGGQPAVWAGEVKNGQVVAGSMLYYPQGNVNTPGFYICGTGSSSGTAEPHCYNTCGQGNQECGGTWSNVAVIDSTGGVQQSLRFPYS